MSFQNLYQKLKQPVSDEEIAQKLNELYSSGTNKSDVEINQELHDYITLKEKINDQIKSDEEYARKLSEEDNDELNNNELNNNEPKDNDSDDDKWEKTNTDVNPDVKSPTELSLTFDEGIKNIKENNEKLGINPDFISIEEQKKQIKIQNLIYEACVGQPLYPDNCKLRDNSGNMCLWNSLSNFIDNTPLEIFEFARKTKPSTTNLDSNMGEDLDLSVTLNKFYERLIVFEYEKGLCTSVFTIQGTGNLGNWFVLIHQTGHWMPANQNLILALKLLIQQKLN